MKCSNSAPTTYGTNIPPRLPPTINFATVLPSIGMPLMLQYESTIGKIDESERPSKAETESEEEMAPRKSGGTNADELHLAPVQVQEES